VGSTVEVPGGFIGAGAATALARLGATRGTPGRASGVLWRAQSASNTWLFVSALLLPSAEQPKRANLALRPLRDLFPAPRDT
jgi:glycine/D-amino acid oxidase-like deaminating enzyme